MDKIFPCFAKSSLDIQNFTIFERYQCYIVILRHLNQFMHINQFTLNPLEPVHTVLELLCIKPPSHKMRFVSNDSSALVCWNQTDDLIRISEFEGVVCN